jgi:hypothetical protein
VTKIVVVAMKFVTQLLGPLSVDEELVVPERELRELVNDGKNPVPVGAVPVGKKGREDVGAVPVG